MKRKNDLLNLTGMLGCSSISCGVAVVLTGGFMLGANSLKAQWSGTNPITTSSYVGIGTSGSNANLDIYGSGDFSTLQVTSPAGGFSANYIGPLRIRGEAYNPDFTLSVFPYLCVARYGFVGVGTESPSDKFHLKDGNILVDNGNITVRDNFGINQFRVESNGFLIARQIDVHLDPIPDYVFHAAFNKDSATLYSKNGKYQMLSLYEIDDFVKKHHHLPGIKNASKYESIGTVNLGELNTKLLEKVEELTLHTISQQRAIDNLIERLEKIESVSTTHNQPNKSQSSNGLIMATFALLAIIVGRGRFSKLFNK
ncbi:MAG: hypothetical protein M0R38_03375 [Bacteroidia bacterium]|nr:hypothetical protein [Bacteroidia bacterium]